MAEAEDNARYSPSTYFLGYRSADHQRHSQRSSPYLRPVGNQLVKEEGDELEEDEEEIQMEDGGDGRNNHLPRKSVDRNLEEGGDADSENGDDVHVRINDPVKVEDMEIDCGTKKRLKTCESFPHVSVQSGAHPSAPKSNFGGRNSLTDWTEHETLALLDAWGDRFLQHGRKSLRSEEWQEVADKVSEVSPIERTDTQCRNRIDTLKKKYKKEKLKLSDMTVETSRWVYFKKMDKLLSSGSHQPSLSCALDPGEYVYMTPKFPFNRANRLAAMQDTPEGSGSTDFQDESDELPPKKRRHGRGKYEAYSFRLIAKSIQKFSKIYEKIETSKRQQMMELEKMRMDLFRELEIQRRHILKRAQVEIARIRMEDNVVNDDSAETANG